MPRTYLFNTSSDTYTCLCHQADASELPEHPEELFPRYIMNKWLNRIWYETLPGPKRLIAAQKNTSQLFGDGWL